MPPVQPSLRGSLLTGASALALSVSGSGADAQTAVASQPGPFLPSTVWIEGALFNTVGGNINVPSLPGFGAPFTTLAPVGGYEGAFGIDLRATNDPAWHFVFDFRYGKSRTATANSSGSSSSQSTTFRTNGTVGGVLQTTTIKNVNSSSNATQTSEWESHLVADFMIGRDIGIGANVPEFQLGIRIADLTAAAQAQQTANSASTTSTTKTTASVVTPAVPPYQPTIFGPATTQSATSSNSTSSTFASWNSQFFGFGPRAAVTGGIPIVGAWTFDYDGGIAALFGERSFTVRASGATGSVLFSTSPMVFVFNADGWAALSYWFSPHVKMSAGLRGDFYDSALTTYNINTGSLQYVNRLYWGPFIRLTGAF